jgi:chemotaxis protein MotB
MADTGTPAPIIIVKKVSGHGGHHGGAWKVAYADFVTALMALFIVLWLVNSSKPVREAVAGYFKDPTSSGKESGSSTSGNGKVMDISKTTSMEDIKKKLEEAMKKMPELQKLKNQIEMTITNDGLRIEMLETEKGVFFESGSPHPSKYGVEILDLLAKEIGTLPNRLLIEGHTDSRPYLSSTGYTNWELSSDRANSARNIMQENGIRPDQVSEVRGYADQKLRKANNPADASNRRISVTVKYLEVPPAPEKKLDEKSEKPGEKGSEKRHPMPAAPPPEAKKK